MKEKDLTNRCPSVVPEEEPGWNAQINHDDQQDGPSDHHGGAERIYLFRYLLDIELGTSTTEVKHQHERNTTR